MGPGHPYNAAPMLNDPFHLTFNPRKWADSCAILPLQVKCAADLDDSGDPLSDNVRYGAGRLNSFLRRDDRKSVVMTPLIDTPIKN